MIGEGTAPILFGKIHFLMITEYGFFHDIQSDGMTSLHGTHALISWTIIRYGSRGLLNYHDDDTFLKYRAVLLVRYHTKLLSVTVTDTTQSHVIAGLNTRPCTPIHA